MRSPNFLILDEPTNDLDIMTLQVLEEYLSSFSGCVIIVSHDRYFMDKVVDHILVFNGNGEVKDFPGNYSQYREWKGLQPKPANEPQTTGAKDEWKSNKASNKSNKLSFKEKREMEQLEKDIERLEVEKKDVEGQLSGGDIPVDRIVELSKRLPELNDELDVKSMRWLELSEKCV